jgi:general secretion pathway protein K
VIAKRKFDRINRTAVGAQQRGVALVLVLWILLLVTISTGAYTLTARMDQLEAHTVLSGTQARLAAEAGLNLAVLSLRDPDELTRLVPDGRSYFVEFEGIRIEVQVTDERGKLNINAASEEVYINLLTANGVPGNDAELLAAAILDWIDEDDIERNNGAELDTYESAGLGVGPANRSFIMTEELLQVLGMSWDLYLRLEPGITVSGGGAEPDPAYAPAEALLALPDMTEEDARNFVAERHSQESLSDLDMSLPSGQVAMARGRGLTYSILAKATMPNGIWDQVEATIRLGGSSDGRPYRVMRWREGFHH